MNFSTVTISTFAIDPLGYISFQLADDASLLTVARRVTFTSTLDGGIAVDDAGASDKDREFPLVVRPKDRLEAEQIKYITLNYPAVRLATREGLFRCVPTRADFSGDQCTWHLRVVGRLA